MRVNRTLSTCWDRSGRMYKFDGPMVLQFILFGMCCVSNLILFVLEVKGIIIVTVVKRSNVEAKED